MHFSEAVDSAIAELPARLQPGVREAVTALQARCDFSHLPVAVIARLPRLFAGSHFARDLLLRHPAWLGELCDADGLQPLPPDYLALATDYVASCKTLPELKQKLRELRQREMLRLAWRDLTGDDLDVVLQGLSALADALVSVALGWLSRRHVERYGQPLDADGEPMDLVVLGMGKLGGDELNFSSDIDLIFAYREAGETGGPKPQAHEQYFRSLAQQLVQALNERTEHGFVYRVDVRLRPFGDSGPLAVPFSAMEQYYQTHGREWERYALIKARPIAGDLEGGQVLLRSLRPFVYRRYLDYSVYDSLRDMKAMIERETARKGMQKNIKLGRGGIREIEFIAQVYQLIRGGQDADLQTRSLRQVLSVLGQRGLLPAEAAVELDQAYVFLRRLENRLQAYADQQTHDLPAAEEERASLAFVMDAADWSELSSRIESVRDTVSSHFARVFGQAGKPTVDEEQESLESLWKGHLDTGQGIEILKRLGFEHAEAVQEELRKLHASSRFRNQTEGALRRTDECVPLLIQAAAQTAKPKLVLQRMLSLLQALFGRTTYVALLVENPTAIPQLARLCAASSWIAEQMLQHPMLLDSLLDPRILYSPPRRAEMEQDLRHQLTQIDADDLERLMDHVRRFKQTTVLRVAAADVSEAVPLMVVSDHLTEIAEVVLQQALIATARQMQARHGRPLKTDGKEAGFAVLGYGKLGGIELGYGSDLDLVFVHDGESNGMTDGEKPLPHEVYFNRLGQRLIHFLSAYTPAGRVYEIDMRLRPNGESGLLVPGLEAFAGYQREHAWTWEHQALVRARWLAGDAGLGQRLTDLRQEILAQPRDPVKLRTEVANMRDKMRGNLEKREPGKLDLKQGSGGIADIEFMVQYFVLNYTHQYPELARYTDNIRILESLAHCGLWEKADAEAICEAYRNLRRAIHHQALQSEPALVAADEFSHEAAQVRACWNQYLADSPTGSGSTGAGR